MVVEFHVSYKILDQVEAEVVTTADVVLQVKHLHSSRALHMMVMVLMIVMTIIMMVVIIFILGFYCDQIFQYRS